MIEIVASLITGPVYLAGENIECSITFSNPLAPQHKTAQSYSDALENLAWASAQIHCQCSTNGKIAYPKNTSLAAEELSITNKDTSFAPCRGENGHVILSTKPKFYCVICDLHLVNAGPVNVYRETLPSEAPPSYRGQAVKYSYKITIGMQRVSSPIKLLRVPFRVLVVSGLPDISVCGDSEDLAPSNPFLETGLKETPLDVALQVLQNITARRTPNFYNITNQRGKVVRFCLFKNSYKLGEDIVGTFDFSTTTVPCVQFSVTLQSEEEISTDIRRWVKQAPAVVSYSKHHEVCLSLKYSQLILPIPLHITPAFSTALVNLKWRLHFEFVTTSTTLSQQVRSDKVSNMWQGPSALDIETMVWNLPVNIYPTTPSQVAQGLQAQIKYPLTL